MPRKSLLSAVMICVLLAACSTVPITGRPQLNIIPTDTMLATSFKEYNQFLSKNKLSHNQAQVQMVKIVGRRIANAVETYMKQHNMAAEAANYHWEFNLVENKEANAWCMPGGKVVVYTGILPLTKNQAGLAVVMGHEIAHAVAHHGNERMSQGLIEQFGGMALSKALETQPAATRQLWMSAYGLGAQVGVLLPYSRLQESEADRLGLIFMAMAGYDPHQAISFWERMARQNKGSSTPAFLRTHPTDQQRIRDIQKLIPEAMQYYTPH